MSDSNIIEEGQESFVKVRLDNQTNLFIEARKLTHDTSEDPYIANKSIPSFKEVTDIIKSISTEVIKVWEEVQPRRATVEFGLEVGIEPGGITTLLVKGSGKANLKITLEWGEDTSQIPTH